MEASLMPATVQIDPENKVIFLTVSGTLADAEMLALQATMSNDPRFQPHFCRLADMRGVDKVELTVDGIRKLAERDIFGSGARRAIVAGQGLIYGFSRMFEMLAKAEETRIFSDINEARKWLGLD
jgi:hypothetical protein